jgi:hypothetical protein
VESLYKEDSAIFTRQPSVGLLRVLRRKSCDCSGLLRSRFAIWSISGCGAGPLSAALVVAGFEVPGIDNSAELLAIARAAVPRAQFVNASIYDAEIPTCEGVIALGEPLTYHLDEAKADRLVQNLFKRVADTLPTGGLFIFDIIEVGEPPLTGRSWSSGEDWAVLVDTQEDQHSRTLVRKIETFRRVDQYYRRGREIHRVRLFDTPVLCHQLVACGFATDTAHAYGAERLAPRRRAFFCTHVERSSPRLGLA